jgi:16S rRNA processing protein RimM
MENDKELVVLGRISGLFGVRGWVKIYSHTAPKEGVLDYPSWLLQQGKEWRPCKLAEGKLHGKGVVARLEGCVDRDQAAQLIGQNIAVKRQDLPSLGADDFYWSDLEGLRVQTSEGEDLGVISHLFETGSNDVMVLSGERERLVPYLWRQVVKSVDLDAGLMVVDWDPDF